MVVVLVPLYVHCGPTAVFAALYNSKHCVAAAATISMCNQTHVWQKCTGHTTGIYNQLSTWQLVRSVFYAVSWFACFNMHAWLANERDVSE